METLVHPLATEKAIRMIETDNMITFITCRTATRSKIKTEFENKFKVKVKNINIIINSDGEKKALIRLSKESSALDVATQLGLM